MNDQDIDELEIGCWIALSQCREFGPRRLARLLDCFTNMREAFGASREALLKTGIDQRAIDNFLAKRPRLNPLIALKTVRRSGIKLVTLREKNYPARLRQIYDPPPILFVRGDLSTLLHPMLAVVGTRHPSRYGEQAVQELVIPLAAAGLVIVSGLAYGIDSLSHQAALAAEGKTVAVLGSGLNHIYPSLFRPLAEQIAAKAGAVISEFPPEMPPLKQNFPIRNRIISGLAIGVLIIEAGVKSGSLITARSALDQDREVFAVPGDIHSPRSAGPNNLLKMGARPVTSPDDIFLALNLEQKFVAARNERILPDSAEEGRLMEVLSQQPMHIDQIARSVNLPISLILSALTLMEMKGRARHVGGMNYVIGTL